MRLILGAASLLCAVGLISLPFGCGATYTAASFDDGGDEASAFVNEAGDGGGCDLTATLEASPACIDDRFGVFVSPLGDDSNPGTKSAPVTTIAIGITQATRRALERVYICQGNYAENVVSKTTLSFFGGLSCSWQSTPDVHAAVVPVSGPGLSITGVAGAVRIENLDIEGAANPVVSGGSAIALFVANSLNVSLRDVYVEARVGLIGADGETGTNYVAMLRDGNPAPGAMGGPPLICKCADGTSSAGGHGENADGTGVTSGSAVPALGSANAGTNIGSACSQGTTGLQGPDGASATTSENAGAITATGWTQPVPSVGANGKTAQGGGGGGASSARNGGGGGGGCGGCGGAGGGAGHAGGSSFALLAFQSAVSAAASTFAAGDGASGGNGAPGQHGNVYGAGGFGEGCNGGEGGNGGNGASGNGGAGGHSIAVAYVGAAPVLDACKTTFGMAGTGGSAGQAENTKSTGLSGPNGSALETQSFSAMLAPL